MANINPKSVYAKTPKGVVDVKNKTAKLTREEGTVFLMVDGKSTVADLLKRSGMADVRLNYAIDKLTTDGYIKLFSAPVAAAGPPATAATMATAVPAGQTSGDDLDFTSPTVMSKLNVEAAVRTKAEAEAKARALAAARAAAEAKVRQEAEARARAQAEAKARTETEAKLKAEAAARAAAEARIKAEAEAKAAANAQARTEAEVRVKAAMEAKARADTEAKARAEGEIRAKADAESKATAEAKAKEEAQSSARAEVDARAHAEAETKAMAAVEAQMKALKEALAQAEQRAKHEAEERIRIEAEIKTRQVAERKAREEAEAHAKATEEAVGKARAMAEEAARVKAATKAAIDAVGDGGEAARAQMESAMNALEEAKAEARSEATARIDAERRAKLEVEARIREDQERKTHEKQERKAREDADARSKAQLRELQEQANSARIEAETKAEIQRKAREEAEARILVERKAREEAEARAETERKSREEALANARVEAEAKARAEVEGMIQAERKAREEADRKAQREIAIRIETEKVAREEAERQTAIARKAREAAESKTREAVAAAGSADSEVARRARAEAESIARKAEAAVAQARAMAESERKARAAAEDRAKTETVARVMQEQQMRANAEGDIEARVQAEIKAREHSEMEAEARYRQEAAARAKAAAEARRNREAEAHAAGKGKPVAIRRSTNWPKVLGVSLVALLAIAAGMLHVVPLNNYIGGAQSLMSGRLGVPVTISSIRYALLPTPQLTLERVGIGKLQEIKIETLVVNAWPMTLLADTQNIGSVEANNVVAGEDALALLPGWLKPHAGPLTVRRVQLKSVRISAKNLDLPPFGGDVTLNSDGTLQRATISDGKVQVELTPKDKALRVALDGRNWRPPLGPAVEFDDIAMEGVIEGQQGRITGIDAKIGRASIKGVANVTWSDNGIRAEGDFSVKNGELAQLMADFTRDFTASGTLNANVNFVLQGTSLQNIFAAPRMDATFNIEKGSLNNIDIVRAIQNPSREGLRGGKTGFNSLAGSLQVTQRNYSYRQLQLTSGPMNAKGHVDVGTNGELSGRITAELGSKTVIVARGNLAVTGNLKTPVLRQ
jgi:hypothetical protein